MDRDSKKDHKIYKYTNKVNGKVYIGRTCQSLEKRAGKEGHGYRRCLIFWRAIQKYGWESFIPEVLEDNLSAKEACTRETFFIEKYDSTNFKKGYNIIETDSNIFSDERRKKISNKAKERVVSDKTKEKLRQANIGRKASEETKKKMSNARKGRKVSAETKEKIRQANTGRKFSEEAKKKMSNARKDKYVGDKCYWWGKKRSQKTKEKISEAGKGRKQTEESRKKISKALRGRSPWNKGKKLSSETCKRTSESRKGEKNSWNKRIKCIETGMEYYSITYAGECTGISMKNISCALNKGLKYTAGGYHWKYLINE